MVKLGSAVVVGTGVGLLVAVGGGVGVSVAVGSGVGVGVGRLVTVVTSCCKRTSFWMPVRSRETTGNGSTDRLPASMLVEVGTTVAI